MNVKVADLVSHLNLPTLDTESEPARLGMKGVSEIRKRTAKPLVFDGDATNRLIRCFILIEQGSNATEAAGMLLPPREVVIPEIGDRVI